MQNEVNDKFRWEQDGFKDDGTLSCLGLGTDRESKTFTCPTTNQSELNGKTFILVDAFVDVKMKGKIMGLYKMKPDFDSQEGDERKVWTGSSDCIRILRILITHNLFPRRVTLISGRKGTFQFK